MCVLRNQYYGGEFSSHSLSSLIDWANDRSGGSGAAKNKIESMINSGENENGTNGEFETLSCNNDLEKYYFDVELKFEDEK